MGLPNEVSSALIGAAAAGGYEIEQSLRLNSDDSYTFRRTPGSDSTSQKKFTVSVWSKRAVIASGTSSNTGRQLIVYTGLLNGAGNLFGLEWRDDEIACIFNGAGSIYPQTVAKFRDPSAWYHIVVAVDTDQATDTDRCKIYVNGVQQTLTGTLPTSGFLVTNGTTSTHTIGDIATFRSNQYLAEVYYINDQQLTPGDFAETNNDGVWVPKKYTGTFTGTNSYYLKFDPSATNGIGHDHSGNGNNFTTTNFTTSGIETDVMSDTPTNNYATINTLSESATGANITFENGNLRINATSAGDGAADATIAIPPSGKFYVEASLINITGGINQFRMGLVNTDDTDFSRPGTNTDSYGFRWNDSAGIFGAYDEGTETSYGTADSLKGDVAGILIDRDNGTIKAHQNDVYFNSGSDVITGIPTNEDYLFRISVDGGSAKQVGATLNFGQRDFLMPPGTTSATDYFNTITWTGNTSSSRSLTGVGFQPDFVIIKGRSFTTDWLWTDVVRGVDAILVSSDADGESTRGSSWRSSYGQITSFDSDGFTISQGSDSANSATNRNGETSVAWCWKAGGTASANTAGDINSSVSVSTDAAFSVFTYTGNGGTDQTVGHGLGTTPSFCIVKSRASNSWYIRHNSLPTNKNLNFNSSGSVDPGGGGLIGDLSSDSTITLKSGSNNTDNVNANGTNYVAYCWADKAGVTATGTYTGDGQDGNNLEQTCGFKPAFVMIKGDATASWQIIDNQRGNDVALFPDSTSSENERSDRKILFTQNGFLVQGNDGNINSGSVNYYWIAFAADFTVDSDYKHLNTANLPAPSIKDGSQYFNTVLYEGNASNGNSITGVGFQPDLTFIKDRDVNGHDYVMTDSTRGTSLVLRPNSTLGEYTQTDAITSFDSDGFTLGDDNSVGQAGNFNTSNSHVAWNWKKGTTPGFDIVTYTGNGYPASGTQNISHNAGGVPVFITIKNRDTTSQWFHYAGPLGAGGGFEGWNDGDKWATNANHWNNTAPTSSVFTVGTDSTGNYNGADHIAYVWAEVPGFSKAGLYDQSGSSDGPFIYLGFSPAFLIIKEYNGGTEAWAIYDNKRLGYNPNDYPFLTNLPQTESYIASTYPNDIDFLSNGFKIRNTDSRYNSTLSNYRYFYMAWAEHPFGGQGAAPNTAK